MKVGFSVPPYAPTVNQLSRRDAYVMLECVIRISQIQAPSAFDIISYC